MSNSLVSCICLSLLLAGSALASPADAARIRSGYETAMTEWSLRLQAAATPEARNAVWQERPDAVAAADAMWRVLAPALAEEWTLEPAAWFLRMAPNLLRQNADGVMVSAYPQQIEDVRKALEKHHLSSLGLTSMCMALVANPDPRSLSLLEKIQSNHPDKEIQGVAALGAAMLLRSLGDEDDLMENRLTYLKKAIIEAVDVKVDNTTIGDLARDEVYIITHLSKGREAPDLQGVDSGGRLMKLSDHKGKVVVVLFWSAAMDDAARTLESARMMVGKHRDKPFALVGVNVDAVDQLRRLVADDTVTWPNFSDPQGKLLKEYRVGSVPVVYVLDAARKVHYVGAPGAFVDLAVEALIQAMPPSGG